MSSYCRINKNGNAVISRFIGSRDRLEFDGGECSHRDGWIQYDTDQDAWYFGVWVHIERREIVTYAEGDYTLVKCVTNATMAAELRDMAEFYGDPPPFAVSYDLENGTRTEYYDANARPTVQP